jgi:hypothetical protein
VLLILSVLKGGNLVSVVLFCSFHHHVVLLHGRPKQALAEEVLVLTSSTTSVLGSTTASSGPASSLINSRSTASTAGVVAELLDERLEELVVSQWR